MSIVLIASICAGVGAIVVLFIAFRCMFRSPRRNPLPPVQMLAHERERQEQQLRQSLYHDIADEFPAYNSPPSRQSLFYPNKSPPLFDPRAGYTVDPGLSPPRRQSGIYRSRSSTSLISSASSESPYDRRSSRVPLGRPKSYMSSRRASIRGPPHHGQVEIVLPAPLAVSHSNPETRRQSFSQSRPTSFYDQWTPPLSRSTSRSRRNSSSEEQSLSQQVRSKQRIEIPPVPPVPPIYSASSASPMSARSSPTSGGQQLQYSYLPP